MHSFGGFCAEAAGTVANSAGNNFIVCFVCYRSTLSVGDLIFIRVNFFVIFRECFRFLRGGRAAFSLSIVLSGSD